MSDRARRRRIRERAAEAPEANPAPMASAPSPLTAFLDDAEAALSELREFESAGGTPGRPRGE
jgi:hypothetical protein